MDRRHSLAVLEMGMNARGEIRRLAEIAEPSIGLILNIGPILMIGHFVDPQDLF